MLRSHRTGMTLVLTDAPDSDARATGDARTTTTTLPIVVADGVAYQSGLVAVEGCAELEVRVDTAARQVDVGELADAEYQPGRRLLGAFGFVGDPPAVKIDMLRHPGYGHLSGDRGGVRVGHKHFARGTEPDAGAVQTANKAVYSASETAGRRRNCGRPSWTVRR